MRVLVISSLYSSKTPSGENIFVQNLIQTFDKFNIKYDFFKIETGNLADSLFFKMKITIIQILNIGNSPLRIIKRTNPDVIIVSNLFPNISSRWMKKASAPIIYFQHNFRINCIAGTYSRNGKDCFSCVDKNHLQGIRYSCYKNSRIASLVASIRILTKRNNRIEIKHTRKFIALHSEAVVLLEKSGIEKSKIEVLNNYLPQITLQKSFENKRQWIYCGRISEEKGIINLLKIWPKSELLHIYGDGPLVNELLELTKNNSNVFYKGLISNDQLVKILAEYEGAIFPSSWKEGFPIVVLEYLRAGVPIISTVGNNVSQIVQESGSGVLFPLDSKSDLIHAIDSVRKHRTKYSINAKTFFEGNYSESIWFNRMKSILNEVSVDQNI